MPSNILFDDKTWQNMLPLTFTRPVSEIRSGILTIREKWEKQMNASFSWLTASYLQMKYPAKIEAENLMINGSVFPSKELIEKISHLKQNQALVKAGVCLAALISSDKITEFSSENLAGLELIETTIEFTRLEYPWDIFRFNGMAIEQDFKLITAGRKSGSLNNTVNVIMPENVFVEEGFQGDYFTLNAAKGSVYLGKDSEIMEGSVIRGPFALCEHAQVKMAAKIYGPTTLGPHVRAGGEINNSVIFGYSNKGHDGFLGNSVIAEWCNLGADTNNSNLKNNYAEVKVWNYPNERFINTGLQFCGLIMGDHSKSGINTMFNTGTVVGVSCNLFGSGFPRNFVPSFSWGGAGGFTEFSIFKAFDVAEKVMARRDMSLSQLDKDILSHVFEQTSKYRNY